MTKTSPSISAFFPCYNEQENIEKLVRKTEEVLESLTDDHEIIIVNDGSVDGTAQIADSLAEEISSVKVVHHKTNSGYGAALQSGFEAASKELIFYTDGDGQFDVGELKDILPLIEDCDIVSCYRLKRQEGTIRKINAYCWGVLVNFVFHMKLRDIDCAFKLYRARVFENMPMKSTGALIDTEVLARASRRGFKIVQHGVHHYPRTAGAPTGASPAVILRAFKELFILRKDILSS
ncbi:Undecaprenyl-phosphate 4-deoxy-4-formamido-L-arabinose transferase [Anaerohalosphaera lusitana]|uniref:Undecaprenyl-phosphate 4-deoxy-4-formamido-L-arabinose transferase n=1 Tax=Anaerohalosphaera lusitana TaxID=1936003 RepID=A0A1U9NME1_9BACT|nr:glycosyltransferase family 2 protein [Anaerohalosphaera lusitana]AQT69005.1 Undecaprenyl-phosphate 4-deoxy-4-formamido-L-arabinose transferase [Anaerohalosphaera lusitana]